MNRALLLTGLIAFLAIGCGPKPEEVIIGSWSGSAAIKRPSTGNSNLDKQLAKVDEKPVQYTLEVKNDKTYVETVSVDRIEGTWTFLGRDLILQPKSVNGKDPAQLQQAVEQSNAKMQIHLDLPPGLDGPETVTLSDDLKTLSVPSIGTTADLKKDTSK